MNLQPGKLLRIYINERDQYGGQALYEAIVQRCREMHVAGATVFRAFEGFGETAELHRHHTFRGGDSLVITIVERPEKVAEVVPVLQAMMTSGGIAISDVEMSTVLHGAPLHLPAE